MNNWANFIRGLDQGPVIRINNTSELKALQKLAQFNKMNEYEYFCRWKYREILHILEINYQRLHSNTTMTFYRATNGRKSFLIEYSYKGFTIETLNGYDNDRQNEDDWKIISMSDIIKELELPKKK